MHTEGLYDDEDRSTDEGVLIRIKLKLLLLLLFYIITIYELRLLWRYEEWSGCRMGGLRQACARTIHGYYYYWVENPFFMCV